jgi:hypothetical protein
MRWAWMRLRRQPSSSVRLHVDAINDVEPGTHALPVMHPDVCAHCAGAESRADFVVSVCHGQRESGLFMECYCAVTDFLNASVYSDPTTPR